MAYRVLATLAILFLLRGTACAQEEIELMPPLQVEASGCEACNATNTRFWLSTDYLLALMKAGKLPPLVTTSPPGTPQGQAGIFGAAGTTGVVEGRVNDELRSGVRVAMGGGFKNHCRLSWEAGFMLVESRAALFSPASDGSVILARPYVNVLNNAPEAILVAFPGVATGGVDVRAESGVFREGHLDFFETFCAHGHWRVEALIGYRYYGYDESLTIRQRVNPLDPAFIPGTLITTTDRFDTENEFHGVDLGVRVHLEGERFRLSVLGKVAGGRLSREVDIQGSQTVAVPGATPTFQNAGLLALASNSGRRGKGEWTGLPEFGVNLSWHASRNISLRMGYSILYLDRIVRAADQIDPLINPTLLPPSTVTPVSGDRPRFALKESDHWFQHVSFGLEWRY